MVSWSSGALAPSLIKELNSALRATSKGHNWVKNHHRRSLMEARDCRSLIDLWLTSMLPRASCNPTVRDVTLAGPMLRVRRPRQRTSPIREDNRQLEAPSISRPSFPADKINYLPLFLWLRLLAWGRNFHARDAISSAGSSLPQNGSILKRHVKVLYAGLVGNVARFLYISWLSDPWWVLPFEFVQGLTHAAVWAACCAYITHAIPGELKSSAQGILQALHHGLGRGCGAVFGGVLVHSFGSVITFRVYGVTCILVLAAYAGVNYFLQDRGFFSHGSSMPHELMEDTSAHLAPHGVPSGIGRDLSSSRLAEDINTQQKDYGAFTAQDGARTVSQDSADPWGGADGYGGYGGYSNEGYGGGHYGRENPFQQGFADSPPQRDRIYTGEPPRMSTQMYQQQPANTYDQGYGP
ncbi:hypothetical protein BaRGS_00029923 [Batillaria attramentaria]|uniref:Major facilitator superfamily associated domain-containing protein n=1 Tax=Batillaria attramentaria TaxID=370345 RepID=A0ABD0JVS6_9CAEN